MRAVRITLTVTASVAFGIAALIGAIVMMMSVAATVRSASVPIPQPGTEAPHFALPDLQGNVVDLTEFRGKRVILVFWADWCPECKAIAPDLNLINDGDVTVLAINLLESKERVAAAVRDERIRYRVVLDRNGDVGRLYGVQAIPNVFVLDEQGIILEHTYGLPKQKGF